MKSTTLFRASLVLTLGATPALAVPPSTSPYATDTQNSHVEDATSRGIGQVNMITCIMGAMKPDALVNDGAYIALVDQAKCDPESRSSNANSDAQAASYMTATVNSTRTSNTEPMRARIWLDEPENDDVTIYVNTSASAAPSANNPYGEFRLDYCGRFDNDTTCMFNGFLEGTANGVSYFEREDNEHGIGTKSLRLTASSTTSGSGRLSMDGFNEQVTFSFAYNADLYRRSDDDGDQCFARDARDPDTGMSVWRYGLYDGVTGERIERNSGFPIEFTHNGVRHQGYLGYWGLSLPATANAALTNGATVEKVDYSDGNAATRTPYTVVKAAGKLTKYTRRTRTLRGIDQIKFNTFVGQEADDFFDGAEPFNQYEMYWDEADGNFKVTGRMNCGENGCFTQSFDAEIAVDADFWAQRGIQGWSQSLGGELFVDLQNVTSFDSGAITVVYRSQDIVYPADLPATLHCVRDCPTAASIAGFFQPGSQSNSPFSGATANNFQPLPAQGVVHYSSDAAAAMLLDGASQPVIYDGDAEALSNYPQYRWGVRSGKLFTNLTDAECALGSGTYCEWKVNGAEVYYMWETGPNNHNQFAAVKNSNGTFVTFDAPLQVTYQVPQGAAYGQYAGKSLVLQYGGFGDLWGIPGVCVSRLSNQVVGCENQDARYVPSFVIPHDADVGKVTVDGSTYLVKWLDREIRFARKDLSVCTSAGLTVPSGITLPTAQDLKDPSNSASDVYIGTRPEVTAAPRVVHGEVKY